MNKPNLSINHGLWLLTVAAIGYLAYSIQYSGHAVLGVREEVAATRQYTSEVLLPEVQKAREEIAKAREDANALAKNAPAIAGEAARQATGRSLDAANPLQNAKREINVGMKKLRLPFKL